MARLNLGLFLTPYIFWNDGRLPLFINFTSIVHSMFTRITNNNPYNLVYRISL